MQRSTVQQQSVPVRSRSVRPAVLLALVGAAALARLAPHPPNLTPVGGMALFAGAHFAGGGAAFGVPLGAMLLSDLVLEWRQGSGFHAGLPCVYFAFALVVWLGRGLRARRQPPAVLGRALAGSLLFFVVTNLGVFLLDGLYQRTLPGLAQCFVAALPFFGNTLAGDLLTAGLLFGAMAWAERRFPALRPASAPVVA